MNNLLTAIMTKISGSALSADVGGRIYLDQAEQGAALPYIVFFIVSDAPDNVFSKTGEDVLIQFSIFSSSESAVEIAAIHADMKALLDDCSLTITSNNLVWMKRGNLTTMVEDFTTQDAAETVKHWSQEYEIITQAA